MLGIYGETPAKEVGGAQLDCLKACTTLLSWCLTKYLIVDLSSYVLSLLLGGGGVI